MVVVTGSAVVAFPEPLVLFPASAGDAAVVATGASLESLAALATRLGGASVVGVGTTGVVPLRGGGWKWALCCGISKLFTVVLLSGTAVKTVQQISRNNKEEKPEERAQKGRHGKVHFCSSAVEAIIAWLCQENF